MGGLVLGAFERTARRHAILHPIRGISNVAERRAMPIIGSSSTNEMRMIMLAVDPGTSFSRSLFGSTERISSDRAEANRIGGGIGQALLTQ